MVTSIEHNLAGRPCAYFVSAQFVLLVLGCMPIRHGPVAAQAAITATLRTAGGVHPAQACWQSWHPVRDVHCSGTTRCSACCMPGSGDVGTHTPACPPPRNQLNDVDVPLHIMTPCDDASCALGVSCSHHPPVQMQQEDRVTEKVDAFSFGVCMWEIWTLGEQPYPGMSLPEIFAVSHKLGSS